MRFILFFFIGLVSIVLQTTFFSHVTLWGVKPDLLLLIVVFMGFIKGKRQGLAFGFAYGLLEDLMVGRFIGLNALVKSAIGYLVGLTEGKIYKENLLAPGLIVLISSLLSGILTTYLMSIIGLPMSLSKSFTQIILPMTIYNIALAPIFYLKFYHAVTKGILSGKSIIGNNHL